MITIGYADRKDEAQHGAREFVSHRAVFVWDVRQQTVCNTVM